MISYTIDENIQIPFEFFEIQGKEESFYKMNYLDKEGDLFSLDFELNFDQVDEFIPSRSETGWGIDCQEIKGCVIEEKQFETKKYIYKKALLPLKFLNEKDFSDEIFEINYVIKFKQQPASQIFKLSIFPNSKIWNYLKQRGYKNLALDFQQIWKEDVIFYKPKMFINNVIYQDTVIDKHKFFINEKNKILTKILVNFYEQIFQTEAEMDFEDNFILKIPKAQKFCQDSLDEACKFQNKCDQNTIFYERVPYLMISFDTAHVYYIGAENFLYWSQSQKKFLCLLKEGEKIVIGQGFFQLFPVVFQFEENQFILLDSLRTFDLRKIMVILMIVFIGLILIISTVLIIFLSFENKWKNHVKKELMKE